MGAYRSVVRAVSITVGVYTVGTVRKGVLEPDAEKPSIAVDKHSLVLSFVPADVTSQLFPGGMVEQISIVNKSFQNYTVHQIRNTEAQYCGLTGADFGLRKVFDRYPDDSYRNCSIGQISRFYADYFDSAEDIITCFPPIIDRSICIYKFNYINMNISANFDMINLRNWKSIKQAVIDFLVQSTQP